MITTLELTPKQNEQIEQIAKIAINMLKQSKEVHITSRMQSSMLMSTFASALVTICQLAKIDIDRMIEEATNPDKYAGSDIQILLTSILQTIKAQHIIEGIFDKMEKDFDKKGEVN